MIALFNNKNPFQKIVYKKLFSISLKLLGHEKQKKFSTKQTEIANLNNSSFKKRLLFKSSRFFNNSSKVFN